MFAKLEGSFAVPTIPACAEYLLGPDDLSRRDLLNDCDREYIN